MSESDYVYIFPHLPKTAGEFFKCNVETNLRKHLIRASFEHHEPFANYHTKQTDFYRGRDHFEDYIKSLPDDYKNNIHCVAGHDVYYGIHDLFPHPARYFTFFREPVSRTISLYNFERMAWGIYEHLPNPNHFQGILRKRITDHFLIDGMVPDFETWLDCGYGRRHTFYCSLSDSLQYLNFLDDKRDQASFENALNKFYFVGLTETFDEDAAYLYRLFCVRRFSGNENTSPAFVKLRDLSQAVINKIEALNMDDMLLYDCAIRANGLFKKQTKDFGRKVLQTKFFQSSLFAMMVSLKQMIL